MGQRKVLNELCRRYVLLRSTLCIKGYRIYVAYQGDAGQRADS